jgi:hypothetical protein
VRHKYSGACSGCSLRVGSESRFWDKGESFSSKYCLNIGSEEDCVAGAVNRFTVRSRHYAILCHQIFLKPKCFTSWNELGALCSLNVICNATANISRKYEFVEGSLRRRGILGGKGNVELP